MKYVYAVLTVVGMEPIMQTLVSPSRLTGKQVLERIVMTKEEHTRYTDWDDVEAIVKDMNQRQPLRVEIQEVEVK